jgi:hypothetical protein
VGTVAGLTFGAGAGAFGALGYVGKRVASGAAGVAAGEWASKRWSVEELNEKERKEIEDLKNSSRPLEEKSEEILKIQQKYKKEKIKMVAKRVGVTALAGAGTGLLANFAENFAANAIGGTGGSGSVLEKEGKEAQRKIVEAQGVSESQKIISESLNERFLTWFWISSLEKQNSVIYVPIGQNGLPLFKNVDQAINQTQ